MKNIINVKNYSIKSQLALFLIVIIIPAIAIGLMTYKYCKDIMTQKLTESRLTILGKTADNFEDRFSSIESTAYLIANQENVQETLTGDYRNNENTTSNIEYTRLNSRLNASKNILSLTSQYNYIDSIKIVPTNKKFEKLASGNQFINLDDSIKYPWYSLVKNKTDKDIWIQTRRSEDAASLNAYITTYVRRVFNTYSMDNIIGYVLISIKANSFADYISRNELEDGEKICLVDQYNQILFRSDSNYTKNSELKELLKPESFTGDVGNYFANSEIVTYVQRRDWKLVSIMPVSSINAKLSGLRNIVFSIVVIFTVFSLVLGLLVYRAITRPLNEIVTRMKNIAYGDFSSQGYNVDTRNEVEKVHNNFNWMAKRVAQLMERNIDVTNQKRDAELKALQAQINPHFLYNTLDAINWLAMLNKQDDISNMVKSLSRFFRCGLNDGKEIITIEEEINHVEAFLEIERYRYKNRFKVNFNLDKRLFKYKTVKFILQPFVENAFVHGFKETSGEGTICIQLFSKENAIYFEVIDDGQGMEEEKIEKVLKEKSEGYGVVNVDERIKLKYGIEFGIKIKSELNKGTIVTITIPKTE